MGEGGTRKNYFKSGVTRWTWPRFEQGIFRIHVHSTTAIGIHPIRRYKNVCYFFRNPQQVCVTWHRWSQVQEKVPLQAWSGPEGSRKLRFPDFMTTAQDGGNVFSLKNRPPLSRGNTPGTHFCYRLSRSKGHSTTGRTMSLKNSNDIIGNRTRDLPICSVVP